MANKTGEYTEMANHRPIIPLYFAKKIKLFVRVKEVLFWHSSNSFC